MSKKRDRKKEGAASPAPAENPEPTGAPGRLSWRETGWLLAGGWGALIVCALLWRFWTARPLIVYFSAGAIGICYTLVVLFDRLREE